MSKHYFNRLETLDHMIRTKSTGNPRILGKRIGVSERTVYGYIDILKSLGAPISYCRLRESYFYESDGYFSFRFINRTYIPKVEVNI